MEANAFYGAPLCLFETGRKLCVYVPRFLNGDFEERVGDPERGATTYRVSVVIPGFIDRLWLNLRAEWTGP
jgi:hypothetical protein